MTLEQKLKNLEGQALAAFAAAADQAALYELKTRYLGKQGDLASLMRDMASLSKDEKPAFGKLVNATKAQLEGRYTEREQILKTAALEQKIAAEKLDLTLPGPRRALGSQHPIGLIQDEVVRILSHIGFAVRTGPLIETDHYNFEALNIPPDHPSRDMQDTFYIEDKIVLRTHTSPVQIRVMETEKPPIRVLAPGSVFRCDSDVSHSPHFHQVEGLWVDKKVSMAQLKGTISYFIKELFGHDMKVRFRPSYFPFTEPSAEFDGSCPICRGKGCRMCKYSGWVEIGGCGLVHPKVLESAHLDPTEWQGFAFGFGLERMAILKYGVEDIRLFFDNNIQFLRQFAQ
jgi:phenylalanyl-tRNA synthetase alpha chain